MIFQKEQQEEDRPNLTPMIDIIFQLLIFFVLTAKFVAFEGQLQAFLPKDRGLSSSSSPDVPTGVTMHLSWSDDGRVICQTHDYHMEDVTQEIYRFPDDRNTRQTTEGWMTSGPFGPKADGPPVEYDYAAPSFVEVERYLKYREDAYQARGGVGSKGLPVEINFSGEVPWQMIVNIIDICSRLGITDLALTGADDLD